MHSLWQKVEKKVRAGQYRHGLYHLIWDHHQALKQQGFNIEFCDTHQATYLLIHLPSLDKTERHIRIDATFDTKNKYLVPYHLTRTSFSNGKKRKEHGFFFLSNELGTIPRLQELTFHLHDDAHADAILSFNQKQLIESEVKNLCLPIIQSLLIFRSKIFDSLIQNNDELDDKLSSSYEIFSPHQLLNAEILKMRELLAHQKTNYELMALYSNQQIDSNENLPLRNIKAILCLLDDKLTCPRPIIKEVPKDAIISRPQQAQLTHASKKANHKSKKIQNHRLNTLVDINQSLDFLLQELNTKNFDLGINDELARLIQLEEDYKELGQNDSAVKDKLNKLNAVIDKIMQRKQDQFKEVSRKLDDYAALLDKLTVYADLFDQKFSSQYLNTHSDFALKEFLPNIMEFAHTLHQLQLAFIAIKLDETALSPILLQKKNDLITKSEAKKIFSLEKKYLETWLGIVMAEGSLDGLKKLIEIYPSAYQLLDNTDWIFEMPIKLLAALVLDSNCIEGGEAQDKYAQYVAISDFLLNHSTNYQSNFIKNIFQVFPAQDANCSHIEHLTYIFLYLGTSKNWILFDFILKHSFFSNPSIGNQAMRKFVLESKKINELVRDPEYQARFSFKPITQNHRLTQGVVVLLVSMLTISMMLACIYYLLTQAEKAPAIEDQIQDESMRLAGLR